jgi:hypothetical protein
LTEELAAALAAAAPLFSHLYAFEPGIPPAFADLTRVGAVPTLWLPMPSRMHVSPSVATTVDVPVCGSGIELLLILPL